MENLGAALGRLLEGLALWILLLLWLAWTWSPRAIIVIPHYFLRKTGRQGFFVSHKYSNIPDIEFNGAFHRGAMRECQECYSIV